MPDIFQSIDHENEPNFGFKKSTGINSASQSRVHEVTKNLISIYKQKQMRVFHSMARTKAALRSKEFFRIYLSPSEAIASKKIRFKSKFHPKGRKRPFDYKQEYEKLRGLRESQEELIKVQAHIDKMIEKNMKKLEEEKRQKTAVDEKNQYTTLKELVSLLMLLSCIPNPIISILVKSTSCKDTRAKEEEEAHK